MKRSKPISIALALAAVVCAAGAAAWWAGADRFEFYAGAGVDRASAADHRPRDILWRPPAPLGEPVTTDAPEFEASVSTAGDEMFFVRTGADGDTDLYSSSRTGRSWQTPEPIAGLNTLDQERSPALSPDGAWLYFASDRPGSMGGLDLWRAAREGTGWGDAEPLGPAINSASDDAYPAFTPDGTAMWFATNRPAPADDAGPGRDDASPTRAAVFDLYTAELTGDAAPTRSPLSSDADDIAPAVSPVGDFLYFASTRDGGAGGFDLYRARLGAESDGRAQPLGPDVNTARDELDPAPATEGFELIFSTTAARSAAPAEAPGDVARNDDLFRTVSREVSLAHETRYGDWGAILGLLPWILAALALVLLLAALRGLALSGALDRSLGAVSLMAKCVLASLVIHAALLALLAFWTVKPEGGEPLAGTEGTRVSLTSSSVRSSLESQVRAAAGAPMEIALDQIAPAEEAPALELDPTRSAAPAPRPTVREQFTAPAAQTQAPSAPSPFTTADVTPNPSTEAAPSVSALETPRALTPAPAADEASARVRFSSAPPALAPAPGGVLDLPAASLRDAALPGASPDEPAPEPLRAVPAPGAAAPPPGLPDVPAAAADAPLPTPTLGAERTTVEEASPEIPSQSPAAPAPQTTTRDLGFSPVRTPQAPVTRSPVAEPGAPRREAPPAPTPTTAPRPSVDPTTAPAEFPALDLPGPDAEAHPEQPEPAAESSSDVGWDTPPAPRPDIRFDAGVTPKAAPLPAHADGLPASPRRVTAAPEPAPTDTPELALAPSAASVPEIRLPEPVPVEPERDSITGRVLDARTSQPIRDARVRLDRAEGNDLDARTDRSGAFIIRARNVPANFAISADAPGYTPYAANIERRDLEEGVSLVILLWPENQLTVALEDEPAVHHLGNDAFTGRVNSQFQRRAEGLAITMPFELRRSQLAPHTARASLLLLAKGVQLDNIVTVNGRRLRDTMPPSPNDGSFEHVRLDIPLRFLRPGANELSIQSVRRGDTDYDDFEFVNVRIEFIPASVRID